MESATGLAGIERLERLVYDYISAQAERDAERAKADAERAKADAERAKAQAERDAKRDAERAKAQAERDAKRDAERAKDNAEHKERWKQLEKELGRLGNSYGEQIEAMFVNLHRKFNELGFEFPDSADGGYTYRDANKNPVAQVDRLYVNGDSVMAVEVKAKLKQDDVDGHIERLGKIGRLLKERGDKRRVLGAVAGGIVPDSLLKYAYSKGLYVLVQNGESVSIAPPPENFMPREW